MGLSLPISSPLGEKRDSRCSSHSPVKHLISLERSLISGTKRYLDKEVFKYKAIHPLGEAFRLP